MPLVVLSSGYGGFSRLPGVTVAPGNDGWGVGITPWTINGAQGYNGSNVTNYNDLWQGNKFHVARAALFHNVDFFTKAYQTGFWRGLMKPDILFMPTGGTITPGDTVSIAGDTWTVMYPSNVQGRATNGPGLQSACPIVRAI